MDKRDNHGEKWQFSHILRHCVRVQTENWRFALFTRQFQCKRAEASEFVVQEDCWLSSKAEK